MPGTIRLLLNFSFKSKLKLFYMSDADEFVPAPTKPKKVVKKTAKKRRLEKSTNEIDEEVIYMLIAKELVSKTMVNLS